MDKKTKTPKVTTQILVADRGFVWVGKVTREKDYHRIDNCRNIRKWGTEKGLGQLKDGPLSNTVLDDCGTVLVPHHAVIALIVCSRDW